MHSENLDLNKQMQKDCIRISDRFIVRRKLGQGTFSKLLSVNFRFYL